MNRKDRIVIFTIRATVTIACWMSGIALLGWAILAGLGYY